MKKCFCVFMASLIVFFNFSCAFAEEAVPYEEALAAACEGTWLVDLPVRTAYRLTLPENTDEADKTLVEAYRDYEEILLFELAVPLVEGCSIVEGKFTAAGHLSDGTWKACATPQEIMATNYFPESLLVMKIEPLDLTGGEAQN